MSQCTRQEKLKITTKSAVEIPALIKLKESYQFGSRLVSILLLVLGQSSRKAQELLLFSNHQICIWAKRFEKVGIDGLKSRPKTDRKSRIDQK